MTLTAGRAWGIGIRSAVVALLVAARVAVAADLADGAVEGHDQRARVQLQAEAGPRQLVSL